MARPKRAKRGKAAAAADEEEDKKTKKRVEDEEEEEEDGVMDSGDETEIEDDDGDGDDDGEVSDDGLRKRKLARAKKAKKKAKKSSDGDDSDDDDDDGDEEEDDNDEEEDDDDDGTRRTRSATAKKKTQAKAKEKKTKAKAKASKKVVWQWLCGKRWVAYNPDDITLLEDAFTDGEDELRTKKLSFGNKRTEYVFDFLKMTQTNGDTSKVRSIRRATFEREPSGTDDEVGYAKLVRKHSKGWAAGKKKENNNKDRAIWSLGDLPPKLGAREIKYQAALGAQSRRSQRLDYGSAIRSHAHAKSCFDKMLENEARLSGEWACFYHSYSFAALLFEVQAAVAAVLFRFKSTYATLPRLLLEPFKFMGDAEDIMKKFKLMRGQDHDTRFRAVAISTTTSLLAPDSEAPPKNVFLSGYSCGDVSFLGILKTLLVSCHVPKKRVDSLAKEIVKLSEKHGLDVSQFGGKRCSSKLPGHMLQIFMKRHLVDKFAYAALPFGVVDKKRQPLSKALGGAGPVMGQARVCCHPAVFMRANLVRMFIYSADHTFHDNREKFQEELTALLDPILGRDDTREAAARGIFAGSLPDWYDSSDQSKYAKIANKFK
ncbi:hypothetical protein PTSG_01283 [Salpingoeca rosetta]|uniref:WWE domain-containing protein n=1 Tax=Salpingoeca rosetta (strain ATCC 50818 / BSB-021) TaxID=946362 RepID=F2TZW5_SALR5|nr:uncharacterized protein PTSG_01283 [Salpingoeca rosetta]EGD80693.1 hypothetical protein PTSG_01283 [Salpingoeca rosetta]|eukprot:XP_004997254.1 hypothetical protein PTSG_01283 [Salpingoeca rosetta]